MPRRNHPPRQKSKSRDRYHRESSTEYRRPEYDAAGDAILATHDQVDEVLEEKAFLDIGRMLRAITCGCLGHQQEAQEIADFYEIRVPPPKQAEEILRRHRGERG